MHGKDPHLCDAVSAREGLQYPPNIAAGDLTCIEGTVWTSSGCRAPSFRVPAFPNTYHCLLPQNLYLYTEKLTLGICVPIKLRSDVRPVHSEVKTCMYVHYGLAIYRY